MEYLGFCRKCNRHILKKDICEHFKVPIEDKEEELMSDTEESISEAEPICQTEYSDVEYWTFEIELEENKNISK